MCVITAYGVQCLVAGSRGSRAEQHAMRPGRGMLDAHPAAVHLTSDNQQPRTAHNRR